eukprot:TRINITY_DN1209_c0_g1_i1.p1 TRINITY_DN1209_c0_g1~~TRINITY_DN1209_c0_g1_i1.p1  ORF type:complete len:1004 (+),score=333.38 TRINITY_DN1209_c0_g1_i1:70-3081(+)
MAVFSMLRPPAAVFALLSPWLSLAVNLRRLRSPLEAAESLAPLGDEAFAADYVASVDATLHKMLSDSRPHAGHHGALVAAGVVINAGANSSSSAAVETGSSLSDLIERGAAEISYDAALRATQGILPQGVMALVKDRGNHSGDQVSQSAATKSLAAKQDPAEVSQATANLNDMVAKAQARLDMKTGECSQFQLKTEATLLQVTTDLARLGQQLSNQARIITSTGGAIEALNLATQQTTEEADAEKIAYDGVHKADVAQLKERQANLDVAELILHVSKCPDAPASLIQGAPNGLMSFRIETCVNGTTGMPTLSFEDPKLQAAAQKLSDDGRRLLTAFMVGRNNLLSKGMSGFAIKALKASVFGSASDLEEDLDDGDDADDEVEGNTSEATSAKALTALVAQPEAMPAEQRKLESMCGTCTGCMRQGVCDPKTKSKDCVTGGGTYCAKVEVKPVVKKPTKEELKAANKCSAVESDCGVIHDLFAGLWGEMKDLVEQTKAKMQKEAAEHEHLITGFNAQLQAQSTQNTELQATLAEASSTKAAVGEQQTQKQAEKTDLDKLYETTMGECKASMKEILFNEICGVLAVRNNMLKEYQPDAEPPVDCKFSDWVPGECSVPCNDTLVGGVQVLKREVITQKAGQGAACPPLEMDRKCNQIKCPVNCKLSKWSEFGKCTKECGGGVQSRGRTVEVKPKNGGEACEALQEMQPCNTGDCDKDCALSDWTPFAKCSQSCNAGYLERRKREVTAAIGMGKCAKADADTRLERKPCNTQACIGDEQCATKMNLVIAVDASGSITSKGFDIFKMFVKKIVGRLGSNVNVAVVQFGNGVLDPTTQVVSDAKLISALTANTGNVKTAVDGMVWQKGFTNMAQAIFKAKDVLGSSDPSRKDAQSVALVITDGRPSFHFQTNKAVSSLRESSRLMIVQVQKYRKQENAERLKEYASEPWASNYKHIKGKAPLKEKLDEYVTEVLSKLCNALESPAVQKAAKVQKAAVKKAAKLAKSLVM